MNPYVRDRISRKLDTLSDERLYQVLDYVEFLESKYAEKPAPVTNVFQRFADGVEDKLRAGGMAVGTVSEAMGFLNKAMGVLNNVASTTKTVASDVVTAAKTAVDQVGAPDVQRSANSNGANSNGANSSGANATNANGTDANANPAAATATPPPAAPTTAS